MPLRCAVLDDYQNVSQRLADWSVLKPEVEVTVFNESLGDTDAVAKALQGFAIICPMRERTPIPRALIEQLPDLKLIATTGPRNAAIDMQAAKERGITVCGTDSAASPTVELTFALMLEIARKVGHENARMKAGEAWQSTVGKDLHGKTLGIVGLGKLGARVAKIADAFGMKTIAWSQNLTPEKAQAGGAEYVSKEDLLKRADFVTLHVVLSDRTRGLIGERELRLMKPTAYLINTSRGPVVDEAALAAALKAGTIAGAGVDVFGVEPLPRDHPFRTLPTMTLTPHLGYVTEDNYRAFYGETVECIRAWLDGKPIRVIA
ncbi:MAG: D-2-hydroxyacid dehydrogenase family protein [Pseudorhodoplanes sp.]|nr:D-2-hydroxyacid dehydrogenase family protein [Pseudorhodoplanes sp.]